MLRDSFAFAKGAVSLFAEMDDAADALRRNNPDLHSALNAELQMEFRALQRKRMPALGKNEWLTLFETWLEEFKSRLAAERDACRREIEAVISCEAVANGAAKPFVCPCGAEILDVNDARVMAFHQPHIAAASLGRR